MGEDHLCIHANFPETFINYDSAIYMPGLYDVHFYK